MKAKSTEDIKKMLRHSKKKELTAKDFLSTGSTLLNLACTGHQERGFVKGHYYFIVGDSISGKTWLSLTCLAEAAINNNFNNHRFIYDNAEDGALMDIERFFGKAVVKRIEPPWRVKSCDGYSATVEQFYFAMDDAIKDGRPFIYILDSMDSLSSEPEADRFDKVKKAHKEGKETTGSYGDGKAKVNSQMLRRVIGEPLRKSGSILIIVNQTRDNINAMPFQSKKTRSGGHALHFYACLEMWSSIAGKIEKTVNGRKRQLGIESKIRIKKNRITGRERTVTIPIYHSFGIDDVGSCVDFLISEKYWKKGDKIKAKGLGIEGSRKKIIKLIEQNELEKDLHEVVGEVWNEVEEACVIKRKKRYV